MSGPRSVIPEGFGRSSADLTAVRPATLHGEKHGVREGGIALFNLLGLLCIIIGFIAAIVDERILFGALTWFIAAIAFNTLGKVGVPFFATRGPRR
jgi:hypothetical protein